jgi:succinate dehydrogenase flavin-adding protein (antitoxin of CptAB toxin-antitoxin module)
VAPISKLLDKSIASFKEEIMATHDPKEADRIQEILDNKYKPADLAKIAAECKTITKEQQQDLLKLLQKYETIFDGTLGTWDTKPVNLELKDPNCKPYLAKPYPVPHSQERKLKDEVERLCTDGILRKINDSEWAAPSFTIPKPDGTLRSLANFIELN